MVRVTQKTNENDENTKASMVEKARQDESETRTEREDETPKSDPRGDRAEREEHKRLVEEHSFAAYGTEEDPYGRTNHAMTADEVARKAVEEGTLRPDGRPKYSIFSDDIQAQEAERRRQYLETGNDGNLPVDQAAIAANQHPVTAERGEPLTGSVVVTSTEELDKVNALAREDKGQPGHINTETEKVKAAEAREAEKETDKK